MGWNGAERAVVLVLVLREAEYVFIRGSRSSSCSASSVLVTVVTSCAPTKQFLGQDLAVVPDYFPSLVFQSPIQFSAFLDDLLFIIIFLDFFPVVHF